MRVTILGANGFIGRKIATQLARSGLPGGGKPESLILFDLVTPPVPEASFRVQAISGDLAELPPQAIPPGTDLVFHLAAVVSAQAEADYELGRRVNLRGTDAVIDACRRLAHPPRLVFTSSVATYSGGQNAVLDDDARQIPANTYGAQKAAAELIVGDASRRGFLDAVSIRLPTIVVRPGSPNRAASSFVSSIVREPLLDLEAELPVANDFAIWIASPRRAVDWLLHAAVMDTTPMGLDRGINPPGLSVTVAHLLQALDQVRPGASSLVRRRPDPAISAIVAHWPAAFDTVRAKTFGFASHEPLVELVRAFLEDDLEATKRERGL
ncbi:MAG: NAD-dependent epimerase/dehydratase family protein [Acetobacteraceae bacterium]|nr:NAD-dependent epimerase/dehydratase family protein [Acetobacteraceae bacterium]